MDCDGKLTWSAIVPGIEGWKLVWFLAQKALSAGSWDEDYGIGHIFRETGTKGFNK